MPFIAIGSFSQEFDAFSIYFVDPGSKIGKGNSKEEQDSCSDDLLVHCALSLHFGILNLCFSLFCPRVELSFAILAFRMPFSATRSFSRI